MAAKTVSKFRRRLAACYGDWNRWEHQISNTLLLLKLAELFDDVPLSREAGSFIDQAAHDGYGIAVSYLSLAEIVHLTEQGRVAPAVYQGLRVALTDSLLVFREAALIMEIVEAMRQVLRFDVPDMPDQVRLPPRRLSCRYTSSTDPSELERSR